MSRYISSGPSRTPSASAEPTNHVPVESTPPIMILMDLFSVVLRLAELAFAAIVAGLTGEYLHKVDGRVDDISGRFIYTEVVAALSLVLSIIWLFPFSGSFIHWPADLVISVCWWVSFGLMFDWLDGSCGDVFDWDGISLRGPDACRQWKANIAFTFLSALCWLGSAVVGLYWVHRHREPVVTQHVTRRRWYRRRV